MWFSVKTRSFTLLELHFILTLPLLLLSVSALRHSKEGVSSKKLTKGIEIRHKPDFDTRIVNGYSARIYDHPYQVALELYSNFFGGGVIITSMHVLTAAHCVENYTAHNVHVRVRTSLNHYKGDRRTVKEILMHPQHDVVTYDIAVLKLVEPIPFTKVSRPILLAAPGMSWPIGTKGIITGWGYENASQHRIPLQLHATEIEIMDIKLCKYQHIDNTTMICAGSPSWTTDSCSGDSGGPFVIDGILVGLISYGNGCAWPNFPGVYTKISAFRQFIEEHIQI